MVRAGPQRIGDVMPLEDLVGPNKFITDLVREWPLGIDPFAEGDDHIRGVKNTVLNSFPTVGQARYPASFILPPAGESEEKNGALENARGTTAQRPETPTAGALRWNTTTGMLEQYKGTTWSPVDPLLARGSIARAGDKAVLEELKLEAAGCLRSDGTDLVYGLPRNYIDVGPASLTTPNVLQTSVGEAACSNIVRAMSLPAFTKDISAAWAEGTGLGGMPALLFPVQADTWYRFFAIMKDDGQVDYGWDTDAAAVNLLADAGASYIGYRHILWSRTKAAGAMRAFTQDGDFFQYHDLEEVPLDWNTGLSINTLHTLTLPSIPPNTVGRMNINLISSNVIIQAQFFPTFQSLNNTSPFTFHARRDASGAQGGGWLEVMVDGSQQIYSQIAVHNLNTTDIMVHGWYDRRGRDSA